MLRPTLSAIYAQKAGPSLRRKYKHIERDGLYARQACQLLLQESGQRKGLLSVSIRAGAGASKRLEKEGSM